MRLDLAITNCKLVTPAGTIDAGLGIKDGKIVALGPDSSFSDTGDRIDAKGCHVLPGLVDTHVHFREPGFTEKEDFESGSKSAAAGGVTTVFDMPNTNPPTSTLKAFEEKRALAEGRSYVNFGLYGMILQENHGEFKRMADAGAIGFKIYMSHSWITRHIGGFADDGAKLRALRIIAETGLRVAAHAECDEIIDCCREEIRQDPKRKTIADWNASRPAISEVHSIQRMLLFTRAAGNKLQIAHLNTAEGVGLIRQAKQSGLDVTAEILHHALLFPPASPHEGATDLTSMLLKLTPPIRLEAENRDKLWEAVRDGTIDLIATDHAPISRSIKEFLAEIGDDVWGPHMGGLATVQIGLSLLLTQVNEGRLSLSDVARLASEKPARAFGLFPRKGCIQVGADADLVIVDLAKNGVVRTESLYSKYRVNPYEGWKVRGMPTCTVVGGQVVARDGEIVGKPRGRLVSPLTVS